MKSLARPSIFNYKTHFLPRDILAGVLVALVNIPNVLAFSIIAGLPLSTGFFATIIGSIVFGLLGYSRQLVVAADSASAMLVASGAMLVAKAGSPEYINASFAITLLVGISLAVIGVSRFSFIADLVSRPVMVGFLAGVGVQLIVAQLPAMLGMSANGGVWNHIVTIVNHSGSINTMALTVSGLVLGIVLIMRNSKIPGEVVGLVAAILFAIAFHIGDYGVTFLSAIQSAAPSFLLPTLSVEIIGKILPAVFSIVLVVLVQSSVTARSIASEHDEDVAINHDTFTIGAANILSGLFRGSVVSGSPSRSQFADSLGVRTQLAGIVSAAVLIVALLFGDKFLPFLPMPALAAIVCMLGFRMIRFRELRYMWSVRMEECVVALIALACTVLLGTQLGILVAVGVSLMERLRRQYRPDDAILLRDGVPSKWATERLGDQNLKKIRDDTIVYSFGESLFFENVSYFTARIRRAIEAAKKPVSYIIIDAGAIDDIDYTAVEEFKRLYRQLAIDNISIALAHVSPNLRDQFDLYGITDIVGARNIYTTLASALSSDRQEKAITMIEDLKLSKEKYVVVGGAVLELLHLRDSHNVDLVVSSEIYDEYLYKKHWREVVLTGSKKVLIHEQYTLMCDWMGSSLASLQSDARMVSQIPTVAIDRLIEAKRTLGRKTDAADIELLRDYLNRHRKS